MQLLQKLVKIKSISGHEQKLAHFIMTFCQKNEIPTKMQKGNVIIHLDGKNDKVALIFNAHLDTVNPGDLRKWKYSPFGQQAGKVTDGKLYGLGASDDKGTIAVMLLIAKEVDTLPCDLWFTFVCNEETDGSGTANFLDWFTKSKYFQNYEEIAAILGEPTDLDSIEIGHRGNAFIKLTVNGITGHGGKSYPGQELAVEKMLMVIKKLKKEFKVWKRKYKNKILGEPTMNITSLHTSNGSLNKIPNKCEATLDVRTTGELDNKLEDLLEKTIDKDAKITFIEKKLSPGITSLASHIVGVCKEVLPNIKFGVSLGSTDLSQFINKGIEAVILGPGNKDAMHKEDEYVDLEKVTLAVEIYKKIIYSF